MTVDTHIQAIPNQPISFEDYSDECNESLYVKACAKYNLGDIVYLQFRRGACSGNVLCQLSASEDAELLTNGTFDTDLTDWDADPDWTWIAGKASKAYNGSGTPAILSQDETITAGVTYRLRFKISDYGTTAPLKFIRIGTEVENTLIFLNSGNGDYYFDIMPTSSATKLQFKANANTTFKLDDVSLKELSNDSCFQGDDWEFGENGELVHQTGTQDPLNLQDLTLIEADNTYLIKIKTVARTDGQLWLIYNGVVQFEVLDDVEDYYLTTGSVATAEFYFSPLATYDGALISVEAYKLSKFGTGNIVIAEEDGSNPVDLIDYITYKDDFLTVAFVPEDLGLAEGCFRMEFMKYNCDEDVDSPPLLSNCISFRTSWDCHKLLKAYCDCQGLGFDFTTFWLQHRVPVLKFNPVYPIKKEDYTFSTGLKKRLFAERSKKWNILIDGVSEPIHDTISAQVLCDHFFIEDTEYYFDDKDYVPDWDKNGRKNIAQVKFELSKVQDVIYNNNCCGESGAPQTPVLCKDFACIVNSLVFSEIDLLAPNGNTIKVDWGDGLTSTQISNGVGNAFTHSYAVDGSYLVSICCDGITILAITNMGIVQILNLPDTLQSLDSDQNPYSSLDFTNCPSLTSFNSSTGSLTSLDISGNPLLLSMAADSNNLPVTQINALLVLLDGFGLSGGGVVLNNQTPPAPPSGVGITAAANLVGKGWSVTTD